MNRAGTSWGRWPRYEHRVIQLQDRFTALPDTAPVLPFGNGRSYGDVCLNEGGTLLATRSLDRFASFDPANGIVECESGVLLKEVIDRFLPLGWFPAVTPGTSLVTIGGAIANDVHGKNHHRTGSFGNHVLEFTLQRSDGRLLRCSPHENADWFSATIGGLGLTGLIGSVKLQLRRVPGPWLRGDSQRFPALADFFTLSAASDQNYEYTVAWIDCSASGKQLGRGVFMRANHLPIALAETNQRKLLMPFTPPFSLANRFTLKPFNALYYHRPAAAQDDAIWHYSSFFCPLDGILEWNRLYGPRGFFQYQCVVPASAAPSALQDMLSRIVRSGRGSLLVVLKNFGDIASPGMMSFPRPGATLALDFPNRGAKTLQLLESLDEITRSVGGAVYPAKDARMSAASFRQYFPSWQDFSAFVDPRFSSSFWRRVTGNAT